MFNLAIVGFNNVGGDRMTKNFKKTRAFERRRFMQDFERELIEDEEGDIFTLTGLERARDDDEISDSEQLFMSGYLKS
jgi:hypothetical protein